MEKKKGDDDEVPSLVKQITSSNDEKKEQSGKDTTCQKTLTFGDVGAGSGRGENEGGAGDSLGKHGNSALLPMHVDADLDGVDSEEDEELRTGKRPKRQKVVVSRELTGVLVVELPQSVDLG